MDYTVSLALVDFIPVIFSGIGAYFIAQLISRVEEASGKMAYLAAGLLVLGGLTKAGWKLIIATTGNDIVWLDDLLFVFLGPGFTFMAWALWTTRQILSRRIISSNIWRFPLGVIAAFGLGAIMTRLLQPEARTWVFILLTLTTLANLTVGILLIQQARSQKLYMVAALFLFNLIAVFVLSGMARIPDQSIALQWVEESINVLAQGAFAFAAWKLAKAAAVYFSQPPEVTVT